MKISCYRRTRDLWVGVYWNRSRSALAVAGCVCTKCRCPRLHIYVCLLPTLVIRVIL